MPTITICQITAVTVSPNPVNINSQLAVTATVTEQTINLMDEISFSGDWYSGDSYAQ